MKKLYLICVCLFISTWLHAQLSPFQFTVTAQAETCLGNGQLTFNVQQITPQAFVDFVIYKSSDLTNPVAITNQLTYAGLRAGSYSITARQTLNGSSNTQIQQVDVVDQKQPIVFNTTKRAELCGNDGSITFQVTQGAAQTYSIVSGPMTRTPQSSPVFTGLTAGMYGVEVKDYCGNVYTGSASVLHTSSNITFDTTVGSLIESCQLVQFSTQLTETPPNEIAYPLQVQTLTTWNNGANTNTQTQTVIQGQVDFSFEAPFVMGATYTIQLIVTDRCNAVTQSPVYTVQPQLTQTLSGHQDPCLNTYISVGINNGIPPFMLQFTAQPPSFDPTTYNSQYPGPFMGSVVNFGGPSQPLPQGLYSLQVTDACGQVFSTSLQISQAPVPSHVFQDVGGGKLQIMWSGLLDADIISGPTLCGINYPINLFYFIDIGILTIYGLPPGEYVFKLYNMCGKIINYHVTIPNHGNVEPEIIPSDDPQPPCPVVVVHWPLISSATIIAAPANCGFPLPHNANNMITPTFDLALFGLVTGNYTIRIKTFGCKTRTVTVYFPPGVMVDPTYVLDGIGCTNITIHWKQWKSAVLLSAPASYSNTLPFDYSNLIEFPEYTTMRIEGLPSGVYVFKFTSFCNTEYIFTVTIPPPTPASASVYWFTGCNLNEGAIFVNSPDSINKATLIGAPAAYNGGTLPQNLDSNCQGGAFHFGPVPAGAYAFKFTNACGQEYTKFITVRGLQETVNNLVVTSMCGKIEIHLQYQSNATSTPKFFIQKWNPLTQLWEHPITQVVYTPGLAVDSTTGFEIANNAVTQVDFEGHLRVVRQTIFEVGDKVICTVVLREFDSFIRPNIGGIVPLNCLSTNQRDVQLQVVGGMAPIQYRIVKYNGNPLLINNGTNPVFSQLNAGIYQFEIEDACGEVRVSDVEIAAPIPVVLNHSPFCPGDNVVLSAVDYPQLQYQWYWANQPQVTLSNTNVLILNNYNAPTQGGVYNLQVTSPNGNQSVCFSGLSSITVPNTMIIADAGDNQQRSFCGSPGLLQLDTFLTPQTTPNGSWIYQQLNIGNTWNSSGQPPGDYQFTYHVDGMCQQFDESQLTITIKPVPQIPQASVVNDHVCEGDSVQLQATTIPNGQYQWSGPSGFQSNQQNPSLTQSIPAQSGVYTVSSVLDGCQSGNSQVQVVVVPQIVPQAGVGGQITLCGAPTAINLFQQLSGTYDLQGTWNLTGQNVSIPQGQWDSSQAAPGTYQFTYTVNGQCHAPAVSQVALQIKPLPIVPQFSISPSQVCVGSAAHFSLQYDPNDNLQWQGPTGWIWNGQSQFDIAQAQLTDAGTFTVQSQRDGCLSPVVTQSLTVNNLPDGVIQTECEGSFFKMGVFPVNQSYDPNQATYVWSGPNQWNEHQQEFILSPAQIGLYEVTITTPQQCSAKTNVLLNSVSCGIPRGVSPNNDGKNDSFDLSGFGIVPKVEIFNRYGTKVYEAESYVNQWYGQDYNGRLLPTGTYYYYVELPHGDVRTGWVFVMY